jgi:hypothetical protein
MPAGLPAIFLYWKKGRLGVGGGGRVGFELSKKRQQQKDITFRTFK